MLKRNFYILGSLKLDISHCLLGRKDARISDIKEVISHPQALGQCNDYIENHNFIEKILQYSLFSKTYKKFKEYI